MAHPRVGFTSESDGDPTRDSRLSAGRPSNGNGDTALLGNFEVTQDEAFELAVPPPTRPTSNLEVEASATEKTVGSTSSQSKWQQQAGQTPPRANTLWVTVMGLVAWNLMITYIIVQRDSIWQVNSRDLTLLDRNLTIIGGSLLVKHGNVLLEAADQQDSGRGYGNLVIGTNNLYAEAKNSLIVGKRNEVAADGAVILGGSDNKATAGLSVVAGGFGNVASGDSSLVAGGRNNQAQGTFSTIVGGVDGQVSSEDGFFAPGSTAQTVSSSGQYGTESGAEPEVLV